MAIDTAEININVKGLKEAIAGVQKLAGNLNILEKNTLKTESATIKTNNQIAKAPQVMNKFTTSIKSALPAISSLFLAVGSLKKIFEFGSQAVEMSRLSNATNTSIETLSKWGQVASDLGSSSSSVNSAIEGISQAMEEAKFGQGAFFDKDAMRQGLSVGIGKNAEETMLNIAEKMKGLSGIKANMLADKLGIPRDLVPMLQKGRDAVRGMVEEKKPLFTAEDAERALRVQRAINGVKTVTTELLSKLLGHLAPAIEVVSKAFRWFANLFVEYEGLFISVFAGMVVAMMPILVMLGKMAIASVIAFAPFIAIGAVIAGVGLLLQDLWIGFKGGQSLIFSIVNKIQEFTNGIGVLNGLAGVLWGVFESIGGAIWAIIKPVFAFIDALNEGLTLTDALSAMWATFVDTIKGAFDSFMGIFSSLGNAFSSIFDFFSGSESSKNVGTLPVPQTTAGITNSNKNININNNVNTNISTQNANARQSQEVILKSVNNASKAIVDQSSGIIGY